MKISCFTQKCSEEILKHPKMQVFIWITSCILVTSTSLEDFMRYSIAGKPCCSDLPLAMCGLTSGKCNSEEVVAIQDSTVTENIYKHALVWFLITWGIINMLLFYPCPLLPTYWELLPNLRQHSLINIFKVFVVDFVVVVFYLLLLLFFIVFFQIKENKQWNLFW